MTSQALTDFGDSMQLATELLQLEVLIVDPPPVEDRKRAAALRAGAVVLMVGSWETFLKEMIAEHFHALTRAAGIPRSSLPVRLQTTALWSSLTEALSGPPFIRTDRKDRIASVLRASQLAVSDDIDPAALPNLRSNPKSRVVKDLCADLGIASVWDAILPSFVAKWGAPVPDLPALLDAVVDHRHLAAHSPRVLSISRSDLGDSVRLLLTLAAVLDDHVDAHCQSTRALIASAATAAPTIGATTPP